MRASAAGDRLLAIFDLFDEWFLRGFESISRSLYVPGPERGRLTSGKIKRFWTRIGSRFASALGWPFRASAYQVVKGLG